MKTVFLIIVTTALLISCNSQSGKNGSITEDPTFVAIENIEGSAGELTENLIQTKGLVTHICRHGGQKMFLTDESNETHLLVRASSSIPEFDIALEGSTIEVSGKMIATVKVLDDHDGHDHSDEEDCAAEAKMKENSDSDECTTDITYHLEAISYKEII
jgi:hypothetical protein